jgi:hypothetical protein
MTPILVEIEVRNSDNQFLYFFSTEKFIISKLRMSNEVTEVKKLWIPHFQLNSIFFFLHPNTPLKSLIFTTDFYWFMKIYRLYYEWLLQIASTTRPMKKPPTKHNSIWTIILKVRYNMFHTSVSNLDYNIKMFLND